MTQKRHIKLRFKSAADAAFADKVASMMRMDLAGLANFAVQKVINDVVQQYQKRKEEAEAKAKEAESGTHDTESSDNEGTASTGQLENTDSATLSNEEATPVDQGGS